MKSRPQGPPCCGGTHVAVHDRKQLYPNQPELFLLVSLIFYADDGTANKIKIKTPSTS
jgi:hypothetical protein